MTNQAALPRSRVRWHSSGRLRAGLRVGVLLFSMAVLLGAGEPGRFGKAITHPDTKVLPRTGNYVVKSTPEVSDEGNGVFVLEFETTTATPPVRVDFGSYLPDQTLALPRYRESSLETADGVTATHRVKVDVKRLEQNWIDTPGLIPNHGGIVCYRLEIFVETYPDGGKRYDTLFYDGRFAYRRSGDAGSAEARYQRVPCIVEGPFIDQIAKDSAIVSWKTDLADGGRVECNGTSVKSETRDRFHEVHLKGLKPGMEYTYRVLPDNGPRWKTCTFRTEGEKESSFSFACLSDSRSGVGGGERAFGGVNFKVIREFSLDAYRRGARFFLFGGDLVSGYTTSEQDIRMQFHAWKTAWEPVAAVCPVYESPGNHESLLDVYSPPDTGLGPDGKARIKTPVYEDKRDGEPDPFLPSQHQKSIETLFGEEFVNPLNGPAHGETSMGSDAPPYRECVYYFDWGNSRFIAFDASYGYCSLPEDFGGFLDGYVGDDQLKWISDVLDDATKNSAIRHVFLFAHEPAWPNGGHTGDSMWYNGAKPSPTGWNRDYMLKRRNEFWGMLAAHPKVLAVFAGHEHNYSRTLITKDTPVNPDGSTVDFKHPIWQLTTGGCGAPYYAQAKTLWSGSVKEFTSQLNYLLLHVDGEKVTLEAIGEGGLPIEKAELQ